MSPSKKQKLYAAALKAGFRIAEEKQPGRRLYKLMPINPETKPPINNHFGNYEEIETYLNRRATNIAN